MPPSSQLTLPTRYGGDPYPEADRAFARCMAQKYLRELQSQGKEDTPKARKALKAKILEEMCNRYSNGKEEIKLRSVDYLLRTHTGLEPFNKRQQLKKKEVQRSRLRSSNLGHAGNKALTDPPGAWNSKQPLVPSGAKTIPALSSNQDRLDMDEYDDPDDTIVVVRSPYMATSETTEHGDTIHLPTPMLQTELTSSEDLSLSALQDLDTGSINYDVFSEDQTYPQSESSRTRNPDRIEISRSRAVSSQSPPTSLAPYLELNSENIGGDIDLRASISPLISDMLTTLYEDDTDQERLLQSQQLRDSTEVNLEMLDDYQDGSIRDIGVDTALPSSIEVIDEIEETIRKSMADFYRRLGELSHRYLSAHGELH